MCSNISIARQSLTKYFLMMAKRRLKVCRRNVKPAKMAALLPKIRPYAMYVLSIMAIANILSILLTG